MLKDIVGINLLGANFDPKSKLSLFDSSKRSKVSLVYGKNGSGKSTISRAFNKLRGHDETYISIAETIDSNDNIVSLTEDESKQIFVFNEDYIDNNIRLHEENLETIVVLGEQKDIEDQINKVRQDKEKNLKKVNTQKATCDELNDEKNVSSPKYYIKKMSTALKGDSNWAGRDCNIKGNKLATPVKRDTYFRFVKRNPQKTRDLLVEEFNRKFTEYEKAKNGLKPIDNPVKLNYQNSFDEKTFISLLSEKLEEPILSEREKFIFSLLADKGQSHIQGLKEYFDDKEHKTCPFCMQDVSEDYKKHLLTSIEKVLGEKNKEHQKELNKFEQQEIEIDFDPYKDLDEDVVRKCQESLEEYNNLLKTINDYILTKKNNVYKPIIVKEIDYNSRFDTLIKSLKILEHTRIEFNNDLSDLQSKINELNEINGDIAYYDVIDSYKTYQKQKGMKDAEDKKLEIYTLELKKCNQEIERLEAKKKNIHIAMNSINRSLQYIFFTDNRLSIKYKSDKYYLLSRGQSVTPNKISVGERNAIALCYFFSNIMQNKEERTVYNKEYLLVIDDPVSSFDIENRVGILSFLKYQLHRFLCGNRNTKAVIMTHDIQVFYDTKKLIDEIMMDYNTDLEQSQKSTPTLLELANRTLHEFKFRKRFEYTSLLENIFDYAQGNADEHEIVIGNSMRRVLEAFSTFVYKNNIEEVSVNPKVLKTIKSPYNTYFEHLMYRLVLHGGSHSSDNIKALGSMNFFDYISSDEKKRTAKDVLCFIYCLNNVHILEHLSKRPNAKQMLDSWLQDIKNECEKTT